jgi:predicted nuclease of predicted toxin-antitoxin system
VAQALKLKLDENLSERYARAARERGCDVTTVVQQGLCSAPDATLLDLARKEVRVLITMDKDLSNTVRYPPREYAGIVLLRVPEPITLQAIERAMSIFLDLAATRSPVGRLWVVDRERVREFGDPELPR